MSDDGGDRYRLTEMADDVIAVCDAAAVERVHVVAVSMGGMIAVDVAVRYPARVAALVLLAAMSPDPTAGIGEAFFDGLEADPVAARSPRWARRRVRTKHGCVADSKPLGSGPPNDPTPG